MSFVVIVYFGHFILGGYCSSILMLTTVAFLKKVKQPNKSLNT